MTDDDTGKYQGILTTKDREFLESGGESFGENTRRQKWYRIRRRIRSAILDFPLIIEHVPRDQWTNIFDWSEDERDSYEHGLVAALTFCYLALDARGENFRRLLQRSVNTAWQMLGEEGRVVIEYEERRKRDLGEILEKAEEEGLRALSEGELDSLAPLADRANGLDFDALRQQHEAEREHMKFLAGKRRRKISDGAWTPLMPPDVFDEQGIGDMSEEELRELFGEGYPRSWNLIYDGEEIRRLDSQDSDSDEE